MCQKIAEGTRWTKCGHFQRHQIASVKDCNKNNCERSKSHPKTCTDSSCTKTYGPEIQKDLETVKGECFQCRATAARTLQT